MTTSSELTARRTRFLSVVSHELRTPLTSIASFTASLADDELSAQERPLAIEAVQRNTARMLTLVEDLMLLARLETGDLTPTAVPVEIPAVITGAVDTLATVDPQAAVRVSVDAGPPVRGDAAMLGDLLYVALGAVTGHAADRGANLTATPDGAGWTITVLGRQAEALTEEHLLASTLAVPRAGRGRSLALWVLLAEAVAECHAGAVTIAFDPAEGASVTVRLPYGAEMPG